MSNTFYCLVVGSRSFADYSYLKEVLDYLLKKQDFVCIVSGGADGADALAKRYAMEKQYAYKEFPADWKKHKKAAGYMRNREMHLFISQFPKRGCVAFWDGKSKGTMHSFELAKEYDNPLRIIQTERKK